MGANHLLAFVSPGTWKHCVTHSEKIITQIPANIITPEDLQVFKKELLDNIKKLLVQKETHELKKWLQGNEVRKLLSISAGTLYTLKQSGVLPFTKIGQTNYYDYDDIKRILEDNKQHDVDYRIK